MNLIARSLIMNKVVKAKNLHDLIDSVVCQPITEKCMLRQCEKCKDKKIEFNTSKDTKEQFTYKKWITKKEKTISAKTKQEITVQKTLKE